MGKNVSKPPINAKNLNTDKSCSIRTKLQASETASVTRTRITACWKLEAWMWGKNAPKHRGNTQIQTPAKGGKNEKEKKGGKKKKRRGGVCGGGEGNRKDKKNMLVGNVLTERE